jgi:hypothetical protein
MPSSTSLPHLAASLGVLGPSKPPRVARPDPLAPDSEAPRDQPADLQADDTTLVSGAALRALESGATSHGPDGLAPVFDSDVARELLDAAREAIQRQPGIAVLAQGNLRPQAVAGLYS